MFDMAKLMSGNSRPVAEDAPTKHPMEALFRSVGLGPMLDMVQKMVADGSAEKLINLAKQLEDFNPKEINECLAAIEENQNLILNRQALILAGTGNPQPDPGPADGGPVASRVDPQPSGDKPPAARRGRARGPSVSDHDGREGTVQPDRSAGEGEV